MADHADRLAAINEVADEADGRPVLAQIIGIDRSARQDEGIVVARGRLACRGRSSSTCSTPSAARIAMVLPCSSLAISLTPSTIHA
jgi:hypothetical protein